MQGAGAVVSRHISGWEFPRPTNTECPGAASNLCRGPQVSPLASPRNLPLENPFIAFSPTFFSLNSFATSVLAALGLRLLIASENAEVLNRTLAFADHSPLASDSLFASSSAH